MTTDTKPNAAAPIVFGALIFGIVYAVVRYHIAGPVPWKDLPFYVLNKGVSLSAFVLLMLNFWLLAICLKIFIIVRFL